MNKKIKGIVAVMAGIDVTITIFTPIILAVIWVNIAGFNYSSYVLYGLGLFASLFRAIKIGWLR